MRNYSRPHNSDHSDHFMRCQNFSVQSEDQLSESTSRLNPSPEHKKSKDDFICVEAIPEFHKFRSDEGPKFQFAEHKTVPKMLKHFKPKSSAGGQRLQLPLQENQNLQNHQPQMLSGDQRIADKPSKARNLSMVDYLSRVNSVRGGLPTKSNTGKPRQPQQTIFGQNGHQTADIGRMKFKMKVEELRVSDNGEHPLPSNSKKSRKSFLIIFRRKT